MSSCTFEELIAFAEPVVDNKWIDYIDHKHNKIIRVVHKEKHRHNFIRYEYLYNGLLNYVDKHKYYLIIVYRCWDGDYWVEYKKNNWLAEYLIDYPEKYSKKFNVLYMRKLLKELNVDVM